jgi:endonuclease G
MSIYRSLKRYTLLILIAHSSLTFAKVETVLGELRLDGNPNLPGYIPSSTKNEIILSRHQYVISYDKSKRSPIWAAWKVDESSMGNSGRTNTFSQDLELENYLEQTSSFHAVDEFEYKGSCFDRGHQVPSADRTDKKENNEKTFLMSNMVPQTGFLNRVIWEHLESKTREIVKSGKKVFIVAGPVYDQNFGSIGPNKDIVIPSKNFKIVFILNPNEAPEQINRNTPHISVLMPNVLKTGEAPLENIKELCNPNPGTSNDKEDWKKYQTSIEDIEKISGLKILL